MFLGREKVNGIVLNDREMEAEAAKILGDLKIDIDPRQTVGDLPVSKQQMVEITKALSHENTRLLILDEPSAVLTDTEIDDLFVFIRQLKKTGVGIIYISHKMEEILRISDDVTIMRDGQWVATRPAKELILTPHPGEMSRLTGLSVEAVQADREGVARRYAAQWNAVVVLKGARTVVAAPDGRVCVNPTGNPGLARGGSGDVLAGMMSALLACGLSACEAAACAVWLHGAAADRAARQKGEYGMLPQDIFAHLGQMFAENDR